MREATARVWAQFEGMITPYGLDEETTEAIAQMIELMPDNSTAAMQARLIAWTVALRQARG